MNHHIATLDQLLTSNQDELVEAIVAEQYVRQPELANRYGERGRVRCREDTIYHLAYLNQAVTFGSPTLFADYISWVQTVLSQRNIPTRDLEITLQVLHATLCDRLPPDSHDAITQCIDASLAQLQAEPAHVPSFIESPGLLADLAQQYLNALLRFRRRTASQLILEAVDAGMDLQDIYLSVFQTAQYEIGRLWQMNRISIAQEHYCTAATQLILSQLYPHILTEKYDRGVVVVTCIGSELHELGARMVADFFELDGWHSIYLAANLPAADILKTLKEQNPDLLCLSATMSYHLPLVKALVEQIRKNASMQPMPIIVGGYPFRLVPDLWQKIGADGYGADAREAVTVANQLISRRK